MTRPIRCFHHLLLTLMVSLLLGLAAPSLPPQPVAALSAVALPPTDQLIVALRPSTALATQAFAQPNQVAETLSTTADTALTYVRPLVGNSHVLRLSSSRPYSEVAALAQQLAARPEVLYAEPDARIFPDLTPSDPYYAAGNWHLQAKAAGFYAANLPAAWDITTGAANLGIAIIDTGGLLDHEDLAGRSLASNPGYDMVGDTDIANDGDERDADPSDPGDWVTSAESSAGSLAGCSVSRSSWHGSHVAGTIGATANNGLGVTGINWLSPLMFVRVLGKCGGYTSDSNDAIRWAAGLAVSGLPLNPNPVRVINMSLGAAVSCETSTQSAIDAAVAAGVVVVVAAGNSNADAANSSPGGCNSVITVAASRKDGGKAAYSNYGAAIEIAAPGGASDGYIYSTVNAGTTVPTTDAYAWYQGTSMATPHVTGIVSLMLSANPALTPAQVLQILQTTATPFPAGSDCSGRCGAGIVDAGAAVEEAARRVRTVGFSTTSQTVSEAVGTVSLPIQFNLASTNPITVPYTVTGTATSADHSLTSGTLNVPAGQIRANLTFSILNDTVGEPDETLVITLNSPSESGILAPATLAISSVYTLTIKDDDVAVGTLRPSSLSFADQVVGAPSATKVATLTNISSTPLSINGITVTGSAFARTGGTCATSFPATLRAGASCALQVGFTPTVAGAHTGSLSVATNGTGSPYALTLSGQGLAAGLLSLDTPMLTQTTGAVTLSFKVLRTGGSTGVITTHYCLSEASSGAVLAEGAVPFANGETEHVVSLPLTNPVSRLTLTLSEATGGAHLTEPSSRTVEVVRFAIYLPLLGR
ncbi:MAG: S8 family serine peptidase [Chloroflexales bacterium]